MNYEKKSLISLYLHIPYCLRKCPYCDFVSYDKLDVTHEEYVAGLVAELDHYAGILEKPLVANTVYLGGGTPSLLAPELVQKILAAVSGNWGISNDAELTIEANPGTVDDARLRGYRAAGINRVSIGVQSTDAQSLRLLGRIHTVDEARRAYDAARNAAFDAVGIDLIFGLPGQKLEQWETDLSEALSWKPDHLSAYILKPPEEWETPDDETISQMYIGTVTMIEEHGLRQYEISNFATPGRQSRHNSVYWTGGSYLGLGAAAHSFMASPGWGTRWFNVDNVRVYLDRIGKTGEAVAHREELSAEMACDEAILLGLRLKEGLNLVGMGERFGKDIRAALEDAATALEDQGLASVSEGRLKLTLDGMLLADEIAARLAHRASCRSERSETE